MANRKELSKELINTLKERTNTIANKNPDIKTIIRKLKQIYNKNISEKKLSKDMYLTIAAYLVVYRSLITKYKVS